MTGSIITSWSFGPRAPALSEVEGFGSPMIMSELEARGPKDHEMKMILPERNAQ